MNIRKNILVLNIIWLVIIILSFLWNYFSSLKQREKLALFTARSFFEQILVTRQWNALHGGVYAPVTATTQPNQYLDNGNRDIEINEELMLTLINPAFMTRQISEIATKQKGISFHITSLNPIRPDNKATQREETFLEMFEYGTEEIGQFIEENGRTVYFYMAPLVTETPCLSCHAKQGYKVGDIRGGISVISPFDFPIEFGVMIWSHFVVGMCGFLGIWFIGRKLVHSYEIIKQQAAVDALTGIPNRRSFTECILREFKRSLRENVSLSLLMCDIDSFKAYNDNYGHSAGDECLRLVANGIKSALSRPGDMCARYGGEEFVVVLAHTKLNGAMKVAERIRQTIVDLQIEHAHSPTLPVVTLSIGVATLREETIQSHEDLIKRADAALYHAKQHGRNQVRYYQDEWGAV